MRTTFIRALAVTICAFLAINDFARIDAHGARIVGVILRIVCIFSHTVRPKLADTKIHRSFVTMTLFSCVIMGEFPIFEKTYSQTLIAVCALTFAIRALTFISIH